MMERQTPRPDPVGPVQRTLDSKTVEVLALAVFRTLFKDGVHVPLQMEGLMDMDLVVKDNNVLLNLNKVQAQVPQLSIWRVTFAYHGKPVVEYGRGIKNDMKVYYPQLCFLFLAIWQERRRKSKAKARGEAALDREMVTMSMTDRSPGTAEETTV
jgi:hypothetical protein